MSRQVNNPTPWNKTRPPEWREDQTKAAYMQALEIWARQVYERITGMQEQKSYTVATLPDAADYEAHTVYVSDEFGGPTIAFSDGVNWRRVQDRSIVY